MLLFSFLCVYRLTRHGGSGGKLELGHLVPSKKNRGRAKCTRFWSEEKRERIGRVLLRVGSPESPTINNKLMAFSSLSVGFGRASAAASSILKCI